jgi:hypothetical protein
LFVINTGIEECQASSFGDSLHNLLCSTAALCDRSTQAVGLSARVLRAVTAASMRVINFMSQHVTWALCSGRTVVCDTGCSW